MSEVVFTNIGEFHRGKGNKKTRFGPKIKIGSINKDRNMAPNALASKKLENFLVKLNVPTTVVGSYLDTVKDAEQLRFMNMHILAEVIFYLNNEQIQNDIKVGIENSTMENIQNYVERLMNVKELEKKDETKKLSDDELEIIRIRLAATFVRYLYYLDELKTSIAAHNM
jgi:hypothetical protein